jgi:hypothetical protein
MNLPISFFLSAKSELSHTVIQWIKTFQKDHEVEVKYIKLDNAGENTTLQKEVEENKELKIKFEFTAPYTSQQNGKIERKFTTLWGKVHTMLK